MRLPETRYAHSGEIMIAYQVHGSGEKDLVFSGSTASNIETSWHLPEAAHFFERLGRFARVIRFDRRDTGVSDPIRDDLTLEAHAADALAVMDAVGSDRPVLLGASDGAGSLASLAATQPDRVAGLIALAPSARGASVAPELVDTVVDSLAGEDWPERMVDGWCPEWSADPMRRDRLIRYVRTSATPRQAKRLLKMSLASDVREVLPHVQAPTLVLWPSDGEIIPIEAGREFAELIPGAEFREIPGASFLPYALDVDLLAGLIEEFMTGNPPTQVSNRVLASVLFTDLVASTERASRLGDRSWTDLLKRHHALTRSAVARHGGKTVKSLGDGVLATFEGPAQGVRCAEQVIAEAASQGLEVRSGIHTGEVELMGDDVAGLAVHLAARVMGSAGPGEVIVSRTVRDLVAGSELRFEDRGEHTLKGIDEPWRLYAAVPGPG